jgi:hypothetical protein
MDTIKQKPILNPRQTPDANDPNFYCRSCEKTCTNQSFYRRHLRRIHQIIIDNLARRRVIVNPDIIPPDIETKQLLRGL